MDLLEQMKAMLNESTSFVKSKNYYFESHQCPSKGEDVKIQMNYKLTIKNKEEIVLFGVCSDCKTMFYHEDFEREQIF